MTTLRIERVVSLPTNMTPYTLYLLKSTDNNLVDIYITDNVGLATRHIITKDEIVTLIQNTALTSSDIGDTIQSLLISGTNIKTINGNNILGSGDIVIYADNLVDSVAGKTGDVVLVKADVGLANVDNTADVDKPISAVTQTALNGKEATITEGTISQYWRGNKTWGDLPSTVFNLALTGLSTATNAVITASDGVLAAFGKLQAQITGHTSNVSNPHSVTKAQVGLGSVDNTTDSTKNVLSATKLTTPRTINGVNFDGTGNITINAVDNTSRIASSEKGVPNGVATLDAAGLVPSTQLPSYVDDVIEAANSASFPGTGEVGKIYIALDTNKTYRWSGSTYVYITSGAVDSVAGKTGVVTLTKTDVGLGNVDNTSDANKPISSATQTALNSKEVTITAGTTAQFWRGDKTWRDFATDVRASLLAGLSTATNTIITVSDSVIVAFGKLQAQITGHTGNVSNPHSVTKTQVGLGSVDNTSDIDKPISTATQTALNSKEAAITISTNAHYWRGDKVWGDFSGTARTVALTGLSTATNAVITAADHILGALGKLQAQITGHTSNVSNPHTVTKAQVGLGSVDNTADSAKNVLSAGKWTTARSLSITGDGAWTISTDGSSSATAAFTLAASGVTAGTYTTVTVDAKGRVTAGATLAAADIPALDSAKITTGTFALARIPTGTTSVTVSLGNHLHTGTYEPANTNLLKANVTATLTVGYSCTPYSGGTISSGTYTPAASSGGQQYITNGGAFTLAPPTTATNIILEITNSASAGAITTSGFTKVDGSFTTTSGHKFICSITKTQNYSLLQIQALQ